MNTDGTGFHTCRECHKIESLWNHTTADHKEGEQLEDWRSVGASSCNSGDGMDQRIQSLMFMMMMMMKIKTHISCSIKFSPWKSCRLWDKVEKYFRARRPQMAIWRMHVACWKTNTLSEYVIVTVFPLQQWLRECSSMLHFVYIACLEMMVILIRNINPLKTKLRPLYLKTQSVPRCKHFSSRL